MIRPVAAALVAAALAVLTFARPAAAEPRFPELTGRVVDAAHVLDAGTVSAITSRSEQLERATGRQLVVATVPSLEGLDVQDYGYRLGRAWKIGEAGKNTGVVLVVAPNERKVGIEVGYGLEGTLTDALSSVILQQRVLPKFREGDLNAGVQEGADAIADQLALPDEDAKARNAQAATAQEDRRHHRHSRSGGLPAIVTAVIVFGVLSSMFGGRRRRGWGGSGAGGWLPWVILGAMSGRGGRDDDWGGGGWGGGGGGGGFSGGGGSFGGGGASGSW